MRVNSRGISPTIATVILFIIGISAGIIAFTVVLGYMGANTTPSSTLGQLSVDNFTVKGDSSNSNITVYLRNTGGKALALGSVYVKGFLYNEDTSSTSVPHIVETWSFVINGSNQVNLGVGAVGALYIESSGHIDPSVTSTVKVVCQDGTFLAVGVHN